MKKLLILLLIAIFIIGCTRVSLLIKDVNKIAGTPQIKEKVNVKALRYNYSEKNKFGNIVSDFQAIKNKIDKRMRTNPTSENKYIPDYMFDKIIGFTDLYEWNTPDLIVTLSKYQNEFNEGGITLKILEK